MEDAKKQDKNMIDSMREQLLRNKLTQEALSTETAKLEKGRDKFSLEAAKANSNLM